MLKHSAPLGTEMGEGIEHGLCLPLTIIVPVYNHEKFLDRTIASVLRQEGIAGARIVLSDDCSVDGSFRKMCDLAASGPNVICRRNDTNMGVHDHYRHLVDSVDTEFVSILEGDDCFNDPKRSIALLRALSQRPELDAVVGGYCLIDEHDQILEDRTSLRNRRSYQDIHFEDLLIRNYMASYSNMMYKTDALRCCLNSSAATLGYDWVTNLLIADASPIGFVPGHFSNYRIHGGGAWSSLPQKEQRRQIMTTVKGLAEHLRPKHKLQCELLAVRIGEEVR